MAEQKKSGKEAEAPKEPPTSEEFLGQRYVSYRDEARQVFQKHAYDGKLTATIFDEIQPLLYKPTPPHYIEHTPKGPKIDPSTGRPFNANDKGLPYDVTGLKSMQVQVDRLNDVLGRQHWRKLLHYMAGGGVCKAVIVVGNDLQWCRLDHETGDLLPWTVIEAGDSYEVMYADVLTVADGWGGHKAPQAGNQYKGAETNASKRAIASLGPGADVYRVDYDEDTISLLRGEKDDAGPGAAPLMTDRAFQRQQAAAARQQAQAAQQAEAPKLSPEEIEKFTNEMAAKERETKPLIEEALKVLRGLPEDKRPDPEAIYQMLLRRENDARALQDLISRAKNA